MGARLPSHNDPRGCRALLAANSASCAGSSRCRLHTWTKLLFFWKAGSATSGSGLVIVPFPEQGSYANTGWLDERHSSLLPSPSV